MQVVAQPKAKLLIDGEDTDGKASESLEVLYPADQSTLIGECEMLAEEQVAFVAERAKAQFEVYRKTSPEQRIEILNKLADGIEAEKDELARLITLESGKPIKLSHNEVQRAIGVCRGYAQKLGILEIPTYQLEGRTARVQQFPVGPVLAITPYNFPLNLIVHKLVPAIAAGCSITIKPAMQTPLTAIKLGQLAVEAGYTAINVVPCRNDVAELLVKEDAFRKISFTGSAMVGWYIKSIAGRKSVTLELGGNAACIVEDYEPEKLNDVAKRCAQGAFWYAGQICISLQRLYVNNKIADKFVQAFVQATRDLKVGDPLLPETDVGPMINHEDVNRTRSLIRDAIKHGANVVYGGSTFNMFTMIPTILDRTVPEMKVNKEEVFAPLVTVTGYDGFDKILAQVNDSDFGIHAGVYTQDHEKVEQAYRELEVGGVIINDIPTTRLDYLPYGGIKDSGLGREGIMCGIEEMSYPKVLIQR